MSAPPLSKAARRRALRRLIEARHRVGLSESEIAAAVSAGTGEHFSARNVRDALAQADHELVGAPVPRRRGVR